jgi:signal transduction histidine kinase
VSGGVLSYWFAKRTLKPIQQSHEAQRRFTADASHELRTPITAMRTEIEVALRDKKLTIDASKNLLKSNLEELSKLNSLIEALLRLARLGEEDLEWDVINIQDFVVPAVDRVKTLANKKDIRLIVSEADGKVNGDKGALVELLVTILDNAIKYTPEGKSVKLNVISSDKQRVVEVTDEGPGIDPIEQSKIFERFYRSDNSSNKDKVDGYGLGLSIARQIAELHSASLTVQSEVGKGATFRLVLPVV